MERSYDLSRWKDELKLDFLVECDRVVLILQATEDCA